MFNLSNWLIKQQICRIPFLSNQVSRTVDFSDSAIPIMNFMSIFISVLKTNYEKIFTVVCLMNKKALGLNVKIIFVYIIWYLIVDSVPPPCISKIPSKLFPVGPWYYMSLSYSLFHIICKNFRAVVTLDLQLQLQDRNPVLKKPNFLAKSLKNKNCI